MAVGRAARAAEFALVTVLPSPNGVPTGLREDIGTAAGELPPLSEQARLLEYDPADRDACVGADESLLSASVRLLAVWDGSPSNGRDATAPLVAYARGRGQSGSPARMVELGREEALKLLGSVPVGRVAFTDQVCAARSLSGLGERRWHTRPTGSTRTPERAGAWWSPAPRPG